MSKTEQDLDESPLDDAVDGGLDELTDDIDAHASDVEAELDDELESAAVDAALDAALVDSIEQYASDDVVDSADDEMADDEVVDDEVVDDHVESVDDDDTRDVALDQVEEIDEADADDLGAVVVDETGDDGDGEAELVDEIDEDADDDDEVVVEARTVDYHTDSADDVDADEADAEDPDHDVAAAVFEDDDYDADDFEDDDQTFDVPAIVMATEYDDDDAAAPEEREASPDDPDAREEAPEVSDDILEELRRADIDGPIVEMAPQDDTTSARRRPKRAIDYDPAPVPVPLKVPRILGRKPRVRKVTRVVRHVDPWSVFKIAIIANLVLYVIVLTAGVLLWNVAYATGTVENVERFFESFGWQSFEFNGGEIYHSAWIAGLFLVIGMTGLVVLAATLFNLITDLVGGVRFTVLEEEVVESRTSPMRRFVVRRPEPEIPAVTKDPSGSFIREAVVDDTGETFG